MDYSHYIRPKYDFADDAARFFYECADLMYQKTTQNFSKTNITVFMTEDPERLKTYKSYGGYKTIEAWQNQFAMVMKILT